MIRDEDRCYAERDLITTTRRCGYRRRFGPYCRTHALSFGYAVPITKAALSAVMQRAAEEGHSGLGDPIVDAAWETLLTRREQP